MLAFRKLEANGQLEEAKLVAAQANAEIDVKYDNMLRTWQHEEGERKATQTQVLSTSNGVVVVKERKEDGEFVIKAHMPAKSGGLFGGMTGRSSKGDAMAEASDVQTSTDELGVINRAFFREQGPAGLATLLGPDVHEQLMEAASEQALASSGMITDPKQRDQVYRNTIAALLLKYQVENPKLTIRMIQQMRGVR